MSLDTDASCYIIMGDLETGIVLAKLLEKSLDSCKPEEILDAVKQVRSKMEIAHNDTDVLREQLAGLL